MSAEDVGLSRFLLLVHSVKTVTLQKSGPTLKSACFNLLSEYRKHIEAIAKLWDLVKNHDFNFVTNSRIYSSSY